MRRARSARIGGVPGFGLVPSPFLAVLSKSAASPLLWIGLVSEPLPAKASALASEVQNIDLRAEAADKRRSDRSSVGALILILSISAGGVALEQGAQYLFFIDHSYSDRLIDIAWMVGGSLILAAGAIGYRMVGRNEIVRIVLSPTGLSFIRSRGNSEFWAWHDPDFRMEIFRFEKPAEKVVPKYDFRRSSPLWLEAYRGSSKSSNVETPLAPEAAEAIIAMGRRYGLTSRTVKAAFFWHDAGESLGYFAWQYGDDPALKHDLNGTITRLQP